jgi:hypothetical protein
MMIPGLIGSRSKPMRDHQDSSRRRRIRLWRAGVFAQQKQRNDCRIYGDRKAEVRGLDSCPPPYLQRRERRESGCRAAPARHASAKRMQAGPEESWYHPNTRVSSKSLRKTRGEILPPGIPSAGIQAATSSG